MATYYLGNPILNQEQQNLVKGNKAGQISWPIKKEVQDENKVYRYIY